MSTKIYTGFKLLSPEPMEVLYKFRDQTWPEIERFVAYYNRVAELTSELLEEDASQAFERRHTLGQGALRCIKYSILVVPRQFGFQGIFFGPYKLEELFFQLDEVKRWGYWDNSDPPQQVTDEEWEERRRSWEFLKYGVPAIKSMLEFSPFADYDCMVLKKDVFDSLDLEECKRHAQWLAKKESSNKDLINAKFNGTRKGDS